MSRIDSAALVRFLVGGDMPAVIVEGLLSSTPERPLLDLVSLARILRDFGLPVRGARRRGRWRTTVWGWIVAAEDPVDVAVAAGSFVFLCPDGQVVRVRQVRGRLVAEQPRQGDRVRWEATPTALIGARDWLIHHLPLEPWVPQPRQPSSGRTSATGP